MLSRRFLLPFTIALAGCPGGDGDIGDPCGDNGSCDTALQCVANVCVPRCQRAPECGDGYACNDEGLCILATGENGDACHSEVDCAPGLSCQINNGTSVDDNKRLLASCTAQNNGKPANALCEIDSDCRNGTCALGRCVDLCSETRDCGAGNACVTTPRVAPPSNGQLFDACLPRAGNLVWSIPTSGPEADILLPIPTGARSATVVFRVDDPAQIVGARNVWAPSDEFGSPSYDKPCVPQGPADPQCNTTLALEEFYRNPLRHQPEAGQSVLQIPSSSAAPLEPGAYRIAVSSFRPNGLVGSAIPRVTAILKMDTAVNLDLHFHFLDLDDHPCEDAFGGETLDAARAQDAPFFQTTFLGELRTIFAGAGIALGQSTYEDLRDHADLDALSVEDAPALFSLGTHAQGIDIYFVRSLSPVGLQAFGPNPGPAGLAGSRQSGIAIGVDTLCYRSWGLLARLTAHEVARYMGLYHNVELEVEEHPTWRDGIFDTDPEPGRETTNLMFFSEFGGTEVTAGQREILTKSAVLR
ncbi:MAG: hypothetical protein AB7T06_05115 [Kofleriaceae bacterium]